MTFTPSFTVLKFVGLCLLANLPAHGQLLAQPNQASSPNALSINPVQAVDRSHAASSVSNLVGKEVVGLKYPGGWVNRGHGWSDGQHLETFVKRKNQHAILFEEITEKWEVNKIPKRKILSALSVKVDPQNGFVFSAGCKSPTVEGHIIAEVRFKRCERYSTRVAHAWRLDTLTWQYISIPPNRLRCEFVEWNSGAEESNCPTGIDTSSPAIPTK